MEFVSRALLKWITDEGIRTGLIEPGKPWQNGTCESFNGKFRDECLSVEWFRSREEARVMIGRWRRHFNDDRPHSSLGNLTPTEYAARSRLSPGVSARGPQRAGLLRYVRSPQSGPLLPPRRRGALNKPVLR